MHITIFVYGSWGDIRPHVVLGMALQQAGHTVHVVAARVYEEWVRARNLEFYPLSVDLNTFIKENASVLDYGVIQQLQMVRQVMSPIFTQMGAETLKATRDSDVLITVEFGMSLLVDVVKVNRLKTIFINPAPINPTSEFVSATPPAPGWFPFEAWYNLHSFGLVRRISWSTLSKARNDLRKQHIGSPRSTFAEFRRTMATTPALTTVSRHVLQRPADWDEHFQVTGYLFDDDLDWTPPQDLVDFLDSGEPPVYVGFGSMPDSKPEGTTQTIIDAVEQTGKRAVILTGWAGLGMDDMPDNIHILNYAPHSWLFPKMAAVVHHGGSGTTASGFRAGVPTIIVPHNADQPYWGRRVKELGVGTDPIPRKKLSTDNLAAAITEATSNQILQKNASELGKKIRSDDGLGEAVKAVEAFLAK